MYLDVLAEMIGSREALVAVVAFVGTDTGVRPTVTRQLVGPRERPVTPGPGAGERLLASVSTNVSLQVRTFPVRLIATRIRAGMKSVTDGV